MKNHTFIKKAVDVRAAPLPECHGGRGEVQWKEVVDFSSEKERRLGFLHDDVLDPGVSIGVHPHDADEEYYYVLSGRGMMWLDGVEHEVGPGDLTAVFPGGSHGLRNHIDEPLRIIVFSIS